MSQPSPDAKAVVRALEALATQVRRLADARQSDFALTPDATDDGPTTPATMCSAQYTGPDNPRTACIRAAHHEHRFHSDEFGWNWGDHVAVYPVDPGEEHESGDPACREMETRTCPPSYNGPCGDRPCARFESEDPTPWIDTGSTVRVAHWHPAAAQLAGERQELSGMVDAFVDAQMQRARTAEDAQRSARRDSLSILLGRLSRSRVGSDFFTGDEVALLREHVDAEVREADTARAVAAGNKRHVQTLVPALQRAEADANHNADLVADAVRRAESAERDLRTIRSGLRAAGGDPTQIQNLWAQLRLRNRQWAEAKREVRVTRSMLEEEGGDTDLVDEMLATVTKAEGEAREAQAAIERVRAEVRAMAQELHVAEDDGMRAAINRVLAALDGTEPTTKEN